MKRLLGSVGVGKVKSGRILLIHIWLANNNNTIRHRCNRSRYNYKFLILFRVRKTVRKIWLRSKTSIKSQKPDNGGAMPWRGRWGRLIIENRLSSREVGATRRSLLGWCHVREAAGSFKAGSFHGVFSLIFLLLLWQGIRYALHCMTIFVIFTFCLYYLQVSQYCKPRRHVYILPIHWIFRQVEPRITQASSKQIACYTKRLAARRTRTCNLSLRTPTNVPGKRFVMWRVMSPLSLACDMWPVKFSLDTSCDMWRVLLLLSLTCDMCHYCI